MHIEEFKVKAKKYAIYEDFKGKPIAVHAFYRDIVLAVEHHDKDKSRDLEVFMFTDRTEISDDDADGLIFLGCVDVHDFDILYVYYRFVLNYQKELELLPDYDSNKKDTLNIYNYNYTNKSYIKERKEEQEEELVPTL